MKIRPPIRRISGSTGALRPLAVRVERLEPRRLFDSSGLFNESFIFGPANAPGASGYLPDHGAVFGDRGGGLEYGWNVDETRRGRLRHSSLIPDEYDASIAFSPGQSWQVAVPDGSYHVTVALGDTGTTSGLHEIDVQGAVESFVFNPEAPLAASNRGRDRQRRYFPDLRAHWRPTPEGRSN